MSDPNATRLTLIARLKDHQDHRAWREFVDIYMPVVYGYVVRCGLQDADAADVTQEVFRSVARSIGGFSCRRERGSFRGWLLAVTRSRLADFFAGRHRHVLGSGDSSVRRQIEQTTGRLAESEAWEGDYRRSVFRWAAGRIRDQFQETTWQAFWRTAVDGEGARGVAESLGMTEGAVYIARCRVIARLKEAIEEYDE